MRTLRYLAQAKDDLISIKRYIATESGDLEIALEFVSKLRKQCRNLAELQGQLGRARPELHNNLRSFPFGNYVIFFMYNDDYMDVVTIIEGHREIASLFEDS